MDVDSTLHRQSNKANSVNPSNVCAHHSEVPHVLIAAKEHIHFNYCNLFTDREQKSKIENEMGWERINVKMGTC